MKQDVARHLHCVSYTRERHGNVELLAQDLERFLDARLTVGAEPIDVAAADKTAFRPEAEELQHVEAASDPSIDVDFRPVAHCFDDGGQGCDGGGGAVELPTAVIGDENRVGSC